MAKKPVIKRIRVTIEIDMPETFRLNKVRLANAATQLAADAEGKVVYVATEEVRKL